LAKLFSESERAADSKYTAVNTCQSTRSTLAPRHQAFLTNNSVETQHHEQGRRTSTQGEHFTSAGHICRPLQRFRQGSKGERGECYRFWLITGMDLLGLLSGCVS
jgi:hypothetical protein